MKRRYKNDGKAVMRLNNLQISMRDQVNKKLSEKIYKQEKYDCECGNTYRNLKTIAEKDRYGLQVYTKICPECGLIMTNPRMTQKSYNLFYDCEYRALYVGKREADNIYFKRQIKRGNRVIKFLERNIDLSEIQSVLEIGCGAGGILYPFKQIGKNVTGIDIGSEYLKYGREQGLELRNISTADLVQEEKKYDLIILNHVLEHFLSLKTELENITSLLNQNGLIYIEVPGIQSIGSVYEGDLLMYLQNAHVYYFSKATLVGNVEKYGLTCIAGNEKVQCIFTQSNYTKSKNVIDNNEYKYNMRIIHKYEWLRLLYKSRAFFVRNFKMVANKCSGKKNVE